MSADLNELERLLREATAGPWIEMPMHPYLFANPRGPQPWHHDIVGRFDYHSDANRALIAALRNHAEELIRDARRYRWLRGGGAADHSKRWTQWEVRCWQAPQWTHDLRRSELDAAIDAAIAQEQP